MPPVNIGGELYFTLRQFARITGYFESYISRLFSEGNKIRKLEGIRFAGRPFIKASEVEQFPFTRRSNKQAPGPCQPLAQCQPISAPDGPEVSVEGEQEIRIEIPVKSPNHAAEI
jgi:hypothetical protein